MIRTNGMVRILSGLAIASTVIRITIPVGSAAAQAIRPHDSKWCACGDPLCGAKGASLGAIVSDDPYAERKKLTFEQAERGEPLPSQLKLKEISQELRARLWNVIYAHLDEDTEHRSDSPYFGSTWEGIFRYMHTYRDHAMADEFKNDAHNLTLKVKQIFEKGDYVAIFGWLQFVLRLRTCPPQLAGEIEIALRRGRAAYRVLNNDTIVPMGSDAEIDTLKRALADLAVTEFHGARDHLRKAAEELTGAKYSDSIRESIHAVESVARTLAPDGKLSSALAKLERSAKIHGSMKAAFNSLYGYTSDKQGIRHAHLNEPSASPDEADALFMIGACAAFVSYLINKSRSAGLL